MIILSIIGWGFLVFLALGYLLELVKELAQPGFLLGHSKPEEMARQLFSKLRSRLKSFLPSRG